MSKPTYEELEKRIKELEKVEVEYKKVNYTLLQSERMLKESQEIARLGQWELDLTSNTLYWSSGIYTLFQQDPNEFGASYEAFLDAIHPEDREYVDKAYTDSVKNRNPYDIIHRLLLRDGTVKYVNEICRTEYDKEGYPLRSIGTVQDITDRMKAEEERKKLLLDLGKRVKELNGLYGLGYLTEQVKDLSELFHRFMREIVPESMQFQDQVFAKIELDEKEYCNLEGECNKYLFAPIQVKGKKRGGLTIGYTENLPFTEDFEQKLVDGYAERLGNIIERMETEEELQKLLDELELRVKEKTKDLTEANEKLKQEIIDRKKVEEELKKSHEELHSLSAHLNTIREEERTHIAREIHDELGQVLTAFKMDLYWLHKKLPQEQNSLLEKINSMLVLIDKTIKKVQKISAELRPGLLDDLGLKAAIEWQSEEFQQQTGIKGEINLSFDDSILEQELATAIFRIFQELLTNITRHANATKIKVNLHRESDSLVLEVKDNGKGITEKQISDPMSFGLIGMKERIRFWKGEVTFIGSRNKGTTVRVCVPLQ